MPTGDVNDAQTAKSQADSRAGEDAFIVGAAVDDGFRHAMYELFRDLAPLLEFKNAANAAHGVSSIRSGYADAAARGERPVQLAVIFEHSLQAESFFRATARRHAAFPAEFLVSGELLQTCRERFGVAWPKE